MSNGLNNFPVNEENNPGGNKNFFYRPIEDVIFIPEAIAKLISDSIVFVNGVDGFFTGYSTPETLEFGEKQVVDVDLGDAFEVRISGFYPCAHPDYDDLFDTIAQYRHIVLCVDQQERQRLAGNLEKGLKFVANFTTGGKYANLKGYAFDFYGIYKERQPYYGEVPVLDENEFVLGEQGHLLYWNGIAWVRLNPGNDGEFLQTQGNDAPPVWAEVVVNSAKEKRHDFNGGFSYCGLAALGSLDSASVWKISRITIPTSGTNTVIKVLNNVKWNDRLTLIFP